MMKKKNNPGSDHDDFDPKKQDHLKDLTNKAILNFLQGKLKEKNDKKVDLDALTNTLSEFLNCFIIIGYNFQGEPINVISAHNQQEADSLATLLNKMFMQSREEP